MAGFGLHRGQWLLILPSVGLSAVVVALLFGVAGRPLRAAEVYGGPTDTEGDTHVRVHVSEREADVVRELGPLRLRVTFHGRASERSVEASTDREGWLEVRLPRPADARDLRLSVRDAESGVLLASGTPRLPLAQWLQATRRRDSRLLGPSEGPLIIEARILEGVLAYPFVGHVELKLSGSGPLEGTELELSPQGAALSGPKRIVYEPAKPLVFAVTPQEHSVSLALVARQPNGAETRFSAVLPLVPGANFLERTADGWRVSSPLPRPHLWYSLVDEAGRGPGARVALTAAADGVAHASLPRTALPPLRGPRWLVLSSSADGRSVSTVGYPLDGQSETFDAMDFRLLDGAPQVEAREQARLGRVRSLLIAHIGTVGLLTLLLFLLEVRGADRELRARMQRAGVIELGPRRFVRAIFLGSLCLVLTFSAALVWVSLAWQG